MSDTFLYFKKGSETYVSEHFQAKEFDCPCHYPDCKKTIISKALLSFLEKIRVKEGKPVQINSGTRCVRHNADVGGADGSTHLEGRGADIQVKNRKGIELLKTAEEAGVQSIGLGRNYIHIDDRARKRRWKYA